MIGTIVNTCAIIVGTLVGTVLGRGIKEKYKSALYNALGLASLMIGLNAAIANMPKSRYPVLFIAALAVGSVAGTALDIDGRFRRLVERRSRRGGGRNLADGLSAAILLYCIGPLSMLGPVISALNGETLSSLPTLRSILCRQRFSPLPTDWAWCSPPRCSFAGRGFSGSLQGCRVRQ